MSFKRIYNVMLTKPVIFLFHSLLLLTACSKDKISSGPILQPPPADTATVSPPADSGLKTWLALGDSYTIGASVTETERFPAQTMVLLQNNGFKIAAPRYIATSGWTTLNLQSAIEEQNPQGPFDIVSLLIGVNDQYQRGDTIGYRERFTSLLEKSVELAGNRPGRVFVLSIPDYSVTPFASGYDTARIRIQIDQFNAINAAVAYMYQVNYTNITPASRLAKDDPSLIATDGLHPSGKEYAVWAAMLAPEIKEALNE